MGEVGLGGRPRGVRELFRPNVRLFRPKVRLFRPNVRILRGASYVLTVLHPQPTSLGFCYQLQQRPSEWIFLSSQQMIQEQRECIPLTAR